MRKPTRASTSTVELQNSLTQKIFVPYFVYLLECEDDSFYTGITTDVERRFKEHLAGIGSNFTRAKKAKRMVYTEQHPDRSSALRREAEIKKWPREKKIALVASSTMKV